MASPPVRMIFHLPREADQPVLIQGKQSPWKLLYATKAQATGLGPEWDVRGVYLLFGPGQEDPGNYWVRVGKSAPGTLRKRVPAHVKAEKVKDLWDHALLVCSTIGNGFNSAEAGYLEGQLANLLDSATRAELHEGQRDQDDTLEPWELDELEPVLEVVLAVMRVLGYPPDPAPTEQQVKPTAAKAQTKYSIGDLIDAGLLSPGAQLKPARKQFTQLAAVQEDGSLVLEGKVFASPSAAAVHLVGSEINGWKFWTTEGESGKTIKLIDLRKQLTESPAKPSSPPVISVAGPADEEGPLSPLISAGLITPGTHLTATTKGKTYAAEVTANGLIERDGVSGTPSAIAKAVVGYPINGWRFWHLADGDQPTLDQLRAKLKN